MLKKLIILNVLILSILMLTSCGDAFNVQVPAALGSVTVPPISVVIGNPTAAPVNPGLAPAQGIPGYCMLLYIIIGLVIVIALIAIIAVASKNNNNNNNL
jgi:hypothetical protein